MNPCLSGEWRLLRRLALSRHPPEMVRKLLIGRLRRGHPRYKPSDFVG
jgi:hypothetical protein